MIVDKRLESLYPQVDLVKGVGNPKRGRLCIMSFVAFLSGEGHSDSPSTASPVVRRVAITINDQMPAQMRQRLKPFAPRIIGTRDDLDRLRAEALVAAAQDEIFPRIHRDFVSCSSSDTWVRAQTARVATLCDQPASLSSREGQNEVAGGTADLLCLGARGASSDAAAEWYWAEAIDLLDRLCDIGDVRPAPVIDASRVIWLEGVLTRQHKTVATAAIERVRRLLPCWL